MTNQCQHGQLARVCLICEQAAEIERLTATVAGLRESANLRVRYHAAELADVTAERDEAREEVAALEVDAGRYRWLRDNSCPQVMHPSGYGMGNARGEQLDAAIDAALAARKGESCAWGARSAENAPGCPHSFPTPRP